MYTIAMSAVDSDLEDRTYPGNYETFPHDASTMYHALEAGRTRYSSHSAQASKFRSVHIPFVQDGENTYIFGAAMDLEEYTKVVYQDSLALFSYGFLYLLFAAPLFFLTYKNMQIMLSELQESYDTLEAVNERNREYSYQDMLTGLPNRRAFLEAAHREVTRSLRTGKPLCFMLVDIDHFKQINDTYGHNSGDKALQAFADVLLENLRNEDIVGRYGGEEFCIMLPETTVSYAVEIAQRLCEAIPARAVTLEQGESVVLTASIGVACMQRPGRAQAATDEIIAGSMARADKALYVAKRHGRNRIAVYAPVHRHAAS